MKKNFVLMLCLLFSFGMRAQITFEKTYGTSGDNFAWDVRPTSDGGYIITGTANFSSGVGDIFLMKTDAVGDTLWTRFLGGTGLDQGNAVIATTDGGYMVAGSTSSFGMGGKRG